MPSKSPLRILLPLGLLIPFVALAIFSAQHNDKSADDSVVKASIDTAIRPFPKAFFGFNAQQIRGPIPSDQDFLKSVNQLHPAVLRYPGGTVASYWDWKAGWFKDEIPLKKDWREIRKNPIRLEDLKAACDATGSKALLVLNMCTSDLEYQLQMLRHAKKIGLEVNYIELDNELYISEPIYSDRFGSGTEYAKEANRWITAIRQEFPSAQIAVVGYSAKDSDFRKNKEGINRSLNWNREVLGSIQGADAMTFHLYGGNALNYLKQPGDISGDEDKEPLELQAIFDRKTSAPLALGIPFSRWENAKSYDLKLLPKGMKAWVTEYNLFEREGVVAGTWLHGLYAATQTLLMLESESVALTCFHNLSSSAQFGAIFNTEQGFMRAVKPKPTTLYGLSAAGHALSMVGKALHNADQYALLQFDKAGIIKGARGHQYPSLIGVVCRKENEHSVVVINLSEQTIRLDLSSVLKKGGPWQQIQANPYTQVGSSSDVVKSTGKTALAGMLPAYSVTLINSGVEP